MGITCKAWVRGHLQEPGCPQSSHLTKKHSSVNDKVPTATQMESSIQLTFHILCTLAPPTTRRPCSAGVELHADGWEVLEGVAEGSVKGLMTLPASSFY